MTVLFVDELIPEAIFLAKITWKNVLHTWCNSSSTLDTATRWCHSERKKSCRRDVECVQASARGRKRERNRWMEKWRVNKAEVWGRERGRRRMNTHTQLRVDVFLATSQRSVGGRDWRIRDRGEEHWHKCVWRSRNKNYSYIWMNYILSLIESRRGHWGTCQDYTDLFNLCYNREHKQLTVIFFRLTYWIVVEAAWSFG